MDRLHISFAGAGKVGIALCSELKRPGYIIDLVVSRTEKSAKSLAAFVSSSWSTTLSFPSSSDIIIVAVPDHSLEGVLNEIECASHTIVAHTAGSLGLDIFPGKIKRKGVFYPLQTFSPGRKINFTEVPFLLEADNEATAEMLHTVASSLSRNVSFVDAERRRMLHLAAVFACNFTNHMLAAASEIARNAGFHANILDPLIKETISKALEHGPEKSQTGPAFRKDVNTIEKHLGLLSSTPWLRDLYKPVTESIMEHYKTRNSD